MKQFTRALNLTSTFLAELLERAITFKREKRYPNLSGKILGNVFFNPSLRTRLSFEAAMLRSKGQAVSLSPGGDTWSFESALGVRMDGDRPEHLKEAVRVMSRYVDALGVRSFATLQSLEEDKKETILAAFEEYATVPVISLESAFEHPCQMLADMVTIHETFADLEGKNFCLRWAPHIKPLPLAVPHSALLAAAHLGMNITVVAPTGYELDSQYIERAKEVTESQGATLSFSSQPDKLPSDTHILYVKSWGAPHFYGSVDQQQEELRKLSPWMVDKPLLQPETHLMHCLPVRRNLVISDAALDHERSLIIEEAENRLWAQLAILDWIFSGGIDG